MKSCYICQQPFDPEQSLNMPEHLVGLHLAEQEYKDVGNVCARCLASRGRLAMMYRTECFD